MIEQVQLFIQWLQEWLGTYHFDSQAQEAFNIEFVVDSTKIDKELIRFQNILAKEKALQQQIVESGERKFDFDYEIGLTSGQDARLTFILGQALNQKLIVEMRGGMKFESIANAYRAQGSFELLNGSRLEFFKTFDNKLVNNPYKILFADGNYTCSVADWTATMHGPMKMPDGKVIQPTHKTAKLEFCTVATWKNNEITEERLFYDAVGMMKQLGLS